MRWNELFADLEGQLGAAADAEFIADVADRTRGERASVALGARLAGAIGTDVAVTLLNGEMVRGTLSEAAATWVLVNEPVRQSWIPVHAISAVSGLERRATELSAVALRLSVGHALRALSRDRAQVVVATRGGLFSGVIAQVGADYVELSIGAERGSTVVPFAAMMRITSVAHAT